MDELINDFIAETRDMLQALSGQVVAWEASPGNREQLDEIFRFVHTVKGNSGFFDLPRIEALSHAAEDVLAAVRAGKRQADAALVSAVLAILDRIGSLVEAIETGESVVADDERLIAALDGKALAPEATVPDASHEPRRAARSIRISVELLDRIMNGVSDTVLARNELARRMRETASHVEVEAAFDRVSACIAEIRDAVMRTRMQRIDTLFTGLPRIVRDLAAELGKQVTLDVDGGDVELDREMIETIRDPLTHIVRNAVDHGIEPSTDRLRAGKSSTGTLRVSARQAGNQILIDVSDDGRGIDGEALVRKAIGAGLFTKEAADRQTAQQKVQLIFEPGLSTAREVTAVSGRGVGMDVVRSNIERIGGLVEVDSKPGQGLRLTLRVPLTLTIIPALTILSGGRAYAIPRSAIEEIIGASSGAVRLEPVGGASMVSIRGRRMPYVTLSALLGADDPAPDQTIVLLKPAGGDIYALGVDKVCDHEELVVKPAAPAVMAAGLYAGTTLADDGRPVLLLDPSGLAACAGIDFSEEAAPVEIVPAAAPEREPVSMLLFRAFDGSRRAIRLGAVERIEDVDSALVARTGGRLRVSIGDRIVPLAGCGDTLPTGKLRILRMNDGASDLAYGFAEVIDIVATNADVQPAAAPGEIGGVALIEGEQVEIVDPFWLFATHAAPQPDRRPVCALPEGDAWMEHILRPLIESLGYEVVSGAAATDCDIAIASDEGAPAASSAADIIRIRSRPERAGQNDNSIYRYDRAALLSALAAKGKRHG